MYCYFIFYRTLLHVTEDMYTRLGPNMLRKEKYKRVKKMNSTFNCNDYLLIKIFFRYTNWYNFFFSYRGMDFSYPFSRSFVR